MLLTLISASIAAAILLSCFWTCDMCDGDRQSGCILSHMVHGWEQSASSRISQFATKTGGHDDRWTVNGDAYGFGAIFTLCQDFTRRN